MKDAIALLLGSRKFLVTSLAVVTLGAFVAMGKITPDQFMAYLEKLTMVLVAAIGAEGVAEKWNVPPPSGDKWKGDDIDLTKVGGE